MKRRAVLGCATGALAATAGCLDAVPLLGGESPLELRAMRAEVEPPDAGPEDVTWPPNTPTCRLPDAVVEAHPELEGVLRRAADLPVGEWSTVGVARETGEDINMDLTANCEDVGGIYFHEGEPYWISIIFTSDEGAIDHHAGDGHDHTHTSE